MDNDRDTLREAGALGLEGSLVNVGGIPLQRIELRKLRHAAVLAFEGNFTRAAEKLHITPSALSQSIAKLEEDLGLVLFDRDKGGATLSRVGRQYIGRIDKLLFDARGLAHDLMLASGAHAGEVSFGIRPDAAKIFLGDLLREVVNEAPNLRVATAITINEVLLEYLSHEGLEFIICDTAGPELSARLSSRKIGSFPIDVYMRPEHPLAGLETVTLKDLRTFPLASSVLTGKNYEAVCAWLGLTEADTFPGTIWCDDYAYLMEVVLHGDALLLAPTVAVRHELARGQITKVALTGGRPPRESNLFLITIADRSLSPAAAMIIQKIEALIAARRES